MIGGDKMHDIWNPWHGCRRVSEGCRNCYVYRIDGEHGKSGGEIRLNADFLLPLREGKQATRKGCSGNAGTGAPHPAATRCSYDSSCWHCWQDCSITC